MLVEMVVGTSCALDGLNGCRNGPWSGDFVNCTHKLPRTPYEMPDAISASDARRNEHPGTGSKASFLFKQRSPTLSRDARTIIEKD
jgi:hypothetical protein